MTEVLKQVGDKPEASAEAGTKDDGAVNRATAVTHEGSGGSDSLAGQAPLVITPPPAGQTEVVRVDPGQHFELAADPAALQFVVDGNDLVVGFDLDGDGEPDSFVVFEDMILVAGGGGQPVLMVAGQRIDMDLLLSDGSADLDVLVGQALRTITPPPAGQTDVVRLAPGERFELAANPATVRLAVDGNNLVMGFDLDGDGEPDSFVVFEELILVASGGNPPILVVAGEPIGTDLLVSNALALTQTEEAGATPLETAVGPALGGGNNVYSDNLGDVLDLLVAQGVIPPVVLEFRLIELEDEIVFTEAEPENVPPAADPVLTPASQPGEAGELPPGLVKALVAVGVTTPVVINFDSLAHGTDVNTQFDGVTFSIEPGGDLETFGVAPGFTTSSPNVIVDASFQGKDVTVEFASPVNNLTFTLMEDNQLVVGSVDVYEGGVFAGTVPLNGDGDSSTPELVDLSEFTNITKIVINDTDDGDAIGFDDFSYTTNESSEVVFFKELDVDGVIGDPDDGKIASFGGADTETSLENIVFTLQSEPTFGQLILVTAGGDTSFLTPGDTFSSEDKVWWIATETDISDFLAQPGAPEFLPDVDFLYSVTDEAGDSDTAPVVITLPPPQDPRAALSVFEDTCLNEDTEGQLLFSAQPTDGVSKVGTIVISGFPTGDVADAWVVDPNSVDVFGYTLGVDYTASYDAVSGELAITFTTASFSLGEGVQGTVDVTPNPDSDVDRTLTIEATAVNAAGEATGSDSPTIWVDADADGLEGGAGDDGDGVHLSVAATVLDESGEVPENATFQAGEVGTLNVQATFDDFLDGSETHTIAVFAPGGFTILAIDAEDLPAGVTLVSNSGSIAVFDVDTLDGVGAVDFDLAIQNTSAQEGDYNFLVRVIAEETNTGDEECVDGGEGGIFPVAGDNVAFDDVIASTTVALIEPPELSLVLNGDDDCVEEDSTTSDIDNVVTLNVSPQGDDLLTQVVLEGFQADWTYDLTGLDTDGGGGGVVVTDNIAGDGTVTITFSPGINANYSGTFAVQPPADSDIDHPTITATATVVDPDDPDLKDSGNTTIDIAVDANADAGPGATGGTDDGDLQVLSISIDDISDSGDAGDSFQVGESGNLTVTATFDDFSDGSETHGFTVTAPAGFTIDDVTAADLPLPAGVTYDIAMDGSSITFSMPTDPTDGLESLTVTLDITNVSATEGMPTFEASATATETTTADDECDTTDDDNIATVTDAQSVTVTGVADPTVSINLEDDATFIKEDSEDNLVEFTAATGDASDELTTVVITFPPEFVVGDLDFSSVAGHADVFDVDVDDSGGQVVVTITFDPAVTSFSGSFTLDAPVEDSDVDLDAISIVANVQDQVDNTQTDSVNASLQIDVDAVLDEALDPGADSDVDEVEIAAARTIGLGLNATVVSAGFVNDPPVEGDSGSGGTDDDGSELISVVLVLDNPLPAGVTLSSTGGTVTQDLAADATGKTYVITGADLEAAIDGLQVELPGSFEGSITGTVTVTSKEANMPPGDVVPASGEEPDTSDNVKVLEASFDVTVEDGADPTGGTLSLTVDEAALDLVQDGDDLAAGTTFGNNAASNAETDDGTLIFNAGADPIVDITFGATGGIVVEDEAGNPIPVVWSGSGTDTLTGTLNGVVVIVLSLSGDNTAAAGGTANATVTATLTDAFPHDLGNTGDVTIADIAVDAEDDDGDTGTGTVDVTVLDDAPNDISPDAALIGSNGSYPVSVTEDLDFFDNVGADKPGDVTFDPSLQDVTLLRDDGVTPVTSNGSSIILDISDMGHLLTGYVESGDTAGFQSGEDTTVFTVELNPDAVDEGVDEYSVTLLDRIDTGIGESFTDFSKAPSGNTLWTGILGVETDILLTVGDVVNNDANTSNQGFGSDNNLIDNGETARIDFVTDLDLTPDEAPNANAFFGSTSYIDFTAHETVTVGRVGISGITGGGTVDVRVTAIDDDDGASAPDMTDPGDYFGDGNDSKDNIIGTSIIVLNALGDPVPVTYINEGDAVPPGVVVQDNADGSVTVYNLDNDWVVANITTLDGYNRLEVENVDTDGESFRINEVSFSTMEAGEPVSLDFGVIAADEDGDTSSGTIEVTVLPQIVGTADADTLLADVNGNDLAGRGGDDTLVGSAVDDKLQGEGGMDTISDGDGNDLIIGGDDADIVNLAADGDTDILVYNAQSEAGDEVNGFDAATPNVGGLGGDLIDLSDLLDGGDFTGTTLGEAVTDGYVVLSDDGAGNAQISVDLDGSAGGIESPVLIAMLNGIDLGSDPTALDNNVMVD